MGPEGVLQADMAGKRGRLISVYKYLYPLKFGDI
jgi:hypothetical protein